MGREGFTAPTRSRAIARTSLWGSNFFGRRFFMTAARGSGPEETRPHVLNSGCKEAVC